MQPRIDALRARFAAHGQDHVFRFWSTLGAAARERLAAQADSIDLGLLERVHESTRKLAAPGARRLEPAPIERLPGHGGDARRFAEARERGEGLLAAGRVALLVVAGGQGTRLGFDGPKGAFPIGPVSDRSIFEQMAQKVRGLRRRHGRPIPWYVMTSDATDAATRELFAGRQHFGLPAGDVFFFRQRMVPALDFEGRLILETPERIFESPDGHGGSLTALASSGALADLERRGITRLFYCHVDNPLVRLGDPTYLGFHEEARAEMSCKVVRKLDPMEKMGTVARVNGRLGIVEYTEIDDEHRHARDARGDLVYWGGSIGIHVFDVAFVQRMAEQAEHCLPFHASAKKIPTVDDQGRPLAPREPNGHKLERFVFDALPWAERVLVLETRRDEEYAPVKNAEGSDSPATARRELCALYRRWLTAAGIEAPAGASIEIDHSRFDDEEDLRRSGIRRIAEAGDAIQISSGGPA